MIDSGPYQRKKKKKRCLPAIVGREDALVSEEEVLVNISSFVFSAGGMPHLFFHGRAAGRRADGVNLRW
jgi:hypothetical protein